VLDGEFLAEFKRLTELKWKNTAVRQDVFGFQIQTGTRWLPGLSMNEIAEYEQTLGLTVPNDLRIFLRSMNGTDLPLVNIHGSLKEVFGLYSYPRDLKAVLQRIAEVEAVRTEITTELDEQGFTLAAETKLFPIYLHRYMVCELNLASSVVLSIYGTDAIVYANSTQEYLNKEFLREG
jgi:hypothetical protein